jgi:hypothetical protein
MGRVTLVWVAFSDTSYGVVGYLLFVYKGMFPGTGAPVVSARGGYFLHRGVGLSRLPGHGRDWRVPRCPCRALRHPMCPLWECYGRCHAYWGVRPGVCRMRGEYVPVETADFPQLRWRACDEPG